MFDPRKQTSNIHDNILDPATTSTNCYDNWEPHNFDFQVSQKLGNQFIAQKIEDHEDDDDGGASSPPLWKNSPPRSPVHPINYRSLSPSSRTQAIARGQWELMEMVKNMPESCFELSLKDLVEQPKSFESQEECLVNNNREKKQVVQNIKIKNDQIRKAKMMRSKSIENGGVFLKMVSPVSLRSKKKKNVSANTTRVSPKPDEYENSCSKSLEKEWWKKRFSGSISGSSNNSGSTGRNRSRGSNSNSSSSNSTSSRNNSTRKRERVLSCCWSSLCLNKSILENDKGMTDALE
ncbi:putative acetolactate synthase 1, chloroplastic-like [Capsicum annuum]|uniref:uncharacterized protein LOC107873021 n=1 Tax=Capsicum annuum TaxID=4072 RepID=UPI001FB0A965|nr:uncharacterized protein LOC107873021 [Capsicum annuum]KAF3634976.1 putative acetolactate synthase 1, chloroplastic-like [Capsicum annuum]